MRLRVSDGEWIPRIGQTSRASSSWLGHKVDLSRTVAKDWLIPQELFSGKQSETEWLHCFMFRREITGYSFSESRAWSALKKARALHANAKQHPCLVPDRKEVKRGKDKFWFCEPRIYVYPVFNPLLRRVDILWYVAGWITVKVRIFRNPPRKSFKRANSWCSRITWRSSGEIEWKQKSSGCGGGTSNSAAEN